MKCIILFYYVHPSTKHVQCLLTSWGDVFYVNTAQCKHVMVIFLPKTLSPHVETYCYEHQFGVLQAGNFGKYLLFFELPFYECEHSKRS